MDGQDAILYDLQCSCPLELSKGKTSVRGSYEKCSEDSKQRRELGEDTKRVEYFSRCARAEQFELIVSADLPHFMRLWPEFHMISVLSQNPCIKFCVVDNSRAKNEMKDCNIERRSSISHVLQG
jgi:hypothetical protein